MEPTFKLDPEPRNNFSAFDDSFFKQFDLHEAEPIELAEGIEKRYQFPTFYSNTTCAVGVFLCRYDRAAELMPHPALKPVRMPRGRGLVIFSCYVYRTVSGLDPYNEIAMTIPVRANAKLNLPLLPVAMPNLFPDAGYYVFSMPVTSLENQIRGEKFWGLPKVVHGIDIKEDSENCLTIARDEENRAYFELSVPMRGRPKNFDVSSYVYSVKDGALRRGTTCFTADFNVHEYKNLVFKKGVWPETPHLKLHDTPAAETLHRLEIEPHPIELRYTSELKSCFDLPDPGYHIPR